MRRKIFIIILKVIVYVATLLLGFLGASAVTSCQSPSSAVFNRGIVIINDTIYLGR